MKRRIVRFTAKIMICVMGYQVVIPATRVFALTSGPSQPEVQSFEPVGTTEMVDLFSGDFVYNIPLMDVEGYPINISYHSGINMEQEASWVGLGWNINPGEINRNVRGIPDDFKGDTIGKVLNIKPEKDYRLHLGVNAKFELFGAGDIGVSVGQFISSNNYKGVGIGYDIGASFKTPIASAGIGISAGSLEGAGVEANAGLRFSTSQTEAGNSGSISLSGSTGFNTRTGLKDIGLGVNAARTNNISGSRGGLGFGSSIPVGLQNYVAVVTNPSTLSALSFQVKVGVEIMWGYPNFNTTLSWSTLSYAKDGSLPAYGYLFAQDGQDQSIMDFSREKDGVYNSSLPNLPLSSMTYDVYGISGQGTGGMFRPFRSDIGSVFDPLVSSKSSNDNFTMEFGIGPGPVGGLFEFGTEVAVFRSKVESGPWNRLNFRKNQKKSLFENAYFKQGGELTYSLQQDASGIAGQGPVFADANGQLRNAGGATTGQVPATYSTLENRSARANNLSFITNSEAAISGVTSNPYRPSYKIKSFLNNNDSIKYLYRTGAKRNKAKADHIAEIKQTLPDGSRYVYGLPAMNNFQKEVTFSVQEENRNLGTGMVKFISQQDTRNNATGRENYFQATYTPAYAHSYLLTSVLSPDYSDLSDDGPTEDDLGTYTKFNYSLADSDYRWIAPYQAREGSDSAQYNPGFWSDSKDDKGNYVIGSKEMWYMHSVESKNFVAEFYVSPRDDGRGALKAPVSSGDFNPSNLDGFLLTNKLAPSLSYKLDSIKLYNKHDRFVNQAAATPIKTVIFNYDYSLCQKAPNNINTSNPNAPAETTGKLTLKRIYFRYGKSDKSLLNPYVFTYDNPNNKPYNFALKDRWGNYKKADPAITNYEFPYTNQNKPEADSNATAWHLTEIKLPSGGRLKVKYEADDYSYVQDKRTMEMFKIAGVGSSPSYEPKDVLYENIDYQYDYIYFKRDTVRERPGKTMRENYLEGSDMLYFSFNVDIAAKNKYEHIKGYAKVSDVGICSNNSTYGYIKVFKETAGGSDGKMLNPMTLAGLNTGRYYLPHIIYPGYNEGDPSATEVLSALLTATQELLTLTQNANVRFVKNGLAKKIIIPKSWIRLNTPGYTKVGGGTRVKELRLEDSWDQMAAGGSEADYGRTYDYTTLLDNNTKISSGVASYEPMIGGDENPLRQPVKYTAETGRLMPAIEFFQETPFGESFYPAPTVGYSKVTVTSIHKDIASSPSSARAEDIFEFYTAKDFPIEATFTTKNVPVNTTKRTLTNKEQELQVQQGYELRLNDMHGKAKAISNYVIKPDNINRELITSTRYNYQVDSKGKLDNTVKAVRRSTLVQPSYSVGNMKLGEEVDFTIDSRKREMESNSMTVSFNLNVVNFAIISIPIPTVFFPDLYEHSQFKTMVSTKMVQQYGILKSVEVIDHGAKTVMENVLYDSESGQVLLTKTNNEFDDPLHTLSYPAYWAYDNMGPAYYNSGYEDKVDSAIVDGEYLKVLRIQNKRYFNPGDELLVTYTVYSNKNNHLLPLHVQSGQFSKVLLVTGTDSCKLPGTNTVIEACALKLEPKMDHPSGLDHNWWAIPGMIISDVYIKVLRPGRRNLLNSSVQQLVVNGPFTVNSINDLFSSPSFGIGGSGTSKLISATSGTYTELAVNNEFVPNLSPYDWGFSPYVKGEKGNWRSLANYAWKGARNYVDSHARKDGTFNTFQPFWQQGMQPGDAGTCSMKDYLMYPSNQPGWQKLNEVTVYNAYGLPVEELNAAGIPSTALFANNFTLPIAVATNARKKQIKYLGFEDLMQVQNDNKRKFRIFPALYPVNNQAASIFNYGCRYFVPAVSDYAQGAVLNDSSSHSGKYSLYFNSQANIPVAKVADFAGTPYAYASLWVKTSSGAAPSGFQLLIIATGNDGNGNAISQSFTAFTTKTGSINGWYKMEGKIDISPLTPYTDISVRAPAGYYLDDFRMLPDAANMKSFAYDLFTHRLMAELDENNFATFYEYDQEGVLIRTKKESDRGILTVNEHRRANAKKIQ